MIINKGAWHPQGYELKKIDGKMDPQRMSIVEYLGNDGGHRCGYCGSSSGFVAPGMWAHRLTVRDLQVNLKISNNN